jgi:hypothetical protein
MSKNVKYLDHDINTSKNVDFAGSEHGDHQAGASRPNWSDFCANFKVIP